MSFLRPRPVRERPNIERGTICVCPWEKRIIGLNFRCTEIWGYMCRFVLCTFYLYLIRLIIFALFHLGLYLKMVSDILLKHLGQHILLV